ncbi:hypothetical protein E4U55_000153 [Claviceps digitariae]|nr:hypothetical protein E4U55_000153 [Claviceps digitariae]
MIDDPWTKHLQCTVVLCQKFGMERQMSGPAGISPAKGHAAFACETPDLPSSAAVALRHPPAWQVPARTGQFLDAVVNAVVDAVAGRIFLITKAAPVVVGQGVVSIQHHALGLSPRSDRVKIRDSIDGLRTRAND